MLDVANDGIPAAEMSPKGWQGDLTSAHMRHRPGPWNFPPRAFCELACVCGSTGGTDHETVAVSPFEARGVPVEGISLTLGSAAPIPT